MSGLLIGGILVCAFSVFTYTLIVGKTIMETEYEREKEDEEQIEFMKKYKSRP